jgi:hypothetical protein
MGALLAFVVVLAPLGLGPLGYLTIMGNTFTRYPYISEFGFNPWGMVFGFGTRDDQWVGFGTDWRSRASVRACCCCGGGATSSGFWR